MTKIPGLFSKQADLLGMHSQRPATALLPWIELYYVVHAQGEAAASAPMLNQAPLTPCQPANDTKHRLYPDGGSSLNLYWQGPLIHRVSVVHQAHQLRYYSPVAETVLSIRFAAGGLYGMFGAEANKWQGEHTFWPDEHQWLAELCSALQNQQRTVWHALDWFFLRQARQRQLEPGLVQQWLSYGVQHPLLHIRQQLQQFGRARRTIERAFQREAGIAPGQLHQLQRIKWARTMLWNQPESSITAIALRCHYYDQAHFVHQFSGITGQSPSEYRQRKLSQLYKEN